MVVTTVGFGSVALEKGSYNVIEDSPEGRRFEPEESIVCQ